MTWSCWGCENRRGHCTCTPLFHRLSTIINSRYSLNADRQWGNHYATTRLTKRLSTKRLPKILCRRCGEPFQHHWHCGFCSVECWQNRNREGVAQLVEHRPFIKPIHL